MFSREDIYKHGLPIAIGSSEVQPLQLTNAYSIFANEGLFVPYRSIISITNSTVKNETAPENPIPVISKETADAVNDILVDDSARGNAFGRYINGTTPLFFPNREVALKTGTTNNNTDIWIVGYNKNIIVSIWAGNSDNTPNDKNASGSMLTPILRQIFNNKEVEKYRSTPFNQYVRGFSEKEAKINAEIVKGEHSSLYVIDKESPLIEHWEYSVKKWLQTNINTHTVQTNNTNKNRIIIQERILENDSAIIAFTPLFVTDIEKYEIYIQNKLHNTVYRSPYTIRIEDFQTLFQYK